MKRPLRNDYFDKYDTLNEFVFKARLEDYHFDLEKYVDYLEEKVKEHTESHIVDSYKFNKIQFDEDCHKGEVDLARFGLDPELMKLKWEQICSNSEELIKFVKEFKNRSNESNLVRDIKKLSIYDENMVTTISNQTQLISDSISKQLLINMIDINIELSNNTLEYDIMRGNENPINFERGFISALKKVKEFILKNDPI